MGLIALDAGVVIGFLDGSDPHHERALQVLRAAIDRSSVLALPASVYAEVLVRPARRGAEAMQTVRELVERVPIRVAPLDDRTAAAAAELRANHRSLKLPDALVIASAAVLDADELVTTDRGWPPPAKLGLRAVVTIL